MHVLILHNEVPENAPASDRDTLVQVESVGAALTRLGHECHVLACTLDLEALRQQLERTRPQVVFNLVESLAGWDRLLHLVPSLLDAMQIAYTGVPAQGLFITTDKVLAKRWLRQAGLPTPSWLAAIGDDNEGSGDCRSGRYLVKTVYEHGSFGLDDEFMVVTGDVTDVRARIVEASLRLDRECFAERYIEGREFNLSLLASEPRSSSTRAVRAGDDAKAAIAAGSTEYPAVDVLPPAEIDFSAFPPSKLRVVGYRAKWEEGTFEFDHTPRRFDFPSSDSTLLTDLRDLARRCWSLFGLRGCARVDFRVDRDGRPWILEVNANPCLSLDGGFAAAVRQTGLSYDQAIARILADTNTFGTVGDAV